MQVLKYIRAKGSKESTSSVVSLLSSSSSSLENEKSFWDIFFENHKHYVSYDVFHKTLSKLIREEDDGDQDDNKKIKQPQVNFKFVAEIISGMGGDLLIQDVEYLKLTRASFEKFLTMQIPTLTVEWKNWFEYLSDFFDIFKTCVTCQEEGNKKTWNTTSGYMPNFVNVYWGLCLNATVAVNNAQKLKFSRVPPNRWMLYTKMGTSGDRLEIAWVDVTYRIREHTIMLATVLENSKYKGLCCFLRNALDNNSVLCGLKWTHPWLRREPTIDDWIPDDEEVK